MVRFHFYPFSDSLSSAQFNVISSGSFPLLSNFTLASPSLPVIKEFLVPISAGTFKIYFEPSPKSSIAFVNAIEMFILPNNFAENEATRVSSLKGDSNYTDILSHSLSTIYRINVGGDKLTQDNDALWRNWVPDDEYLANPNSAKRSNFYGGNPNYNQLGGSTEEIAPDNVYRTAKEMNIMKGGSNLFNVTWRFNVSRNASHLVRVHFCEILSQALNLFHFNLYLYSNYNFLVAPYEEVNAFATPFYHDFVVDSDSSGFMNISIGISHDEQNKTAFLNGLEIMELITNSGVTPFVTHSKKINFLHIVESIIGGFVLAVVFGLVFFLYVKKYRKPKPVEAPSEWQAIPLHGMGSTHSKISELTISGSPMCNLNLGWKQSIADILSATHNFDPKLMIGKGGFGKVYKGTFRDGLKVAVKRSELGHGQGFYEFQTEIMVLSQIRHRHLVSLIGYCDEKSEMILVYEFMEKGTLRDHLYTSHGDSQKSISQSELTWKQRLEICIGAAKGLHYLHSDRGIIHRDVKSTNILLDEYYVAKVADFGLSRLDAEDESQVSAEVKGSFGYFDPELFQGIQITQKSDVYSFGVVLLEVLCARPAIDNTLPGERINLAEWGMSSLKKGDILNIIDPLLDGKIDPNSLKLFGEIAEKCLKRCGVDRPSMHDVLWDLEYALQLQQSSKQREAQEESTMEASWALPPGSVQRLPVEDYDISTADFSEDSRVGFVG